MARNQQKEPSRGLISSSRQRSAERRCDDYRRAFLLLLQERFDDLEKTLGRMLEVLATTLDVSRVALWTLDESRASIRCEHVFSRGFSAEGDPATLRREDFATYFDAICTELPLVANDARADARTAELVAHALSNVDSLLDVPAYAFEKHIGVLRLEQHRSSREWMPEEMDFATGVAAQIAMAFERDRHKQAQQKLLERSLRDPESRLANRLHFEQTLDDYLGNTDCSGALVVTSADQYNYVAASIGTDGALRLLREFSARISAAAPANSFVARIATNEFAMLLRDKPRAGIAALVEQWNADARLPIQLDEHLIFPSLSTGYALIEATELQSVESLIAEAQMATLEARTAGCSRAAPFTAEMREKMTSRIRLEQDLRRAVSASEFELHFQPIIPLGGRGSVSLEALLRWRHPRRGLLSPADFIEVAVQSGIMLELGRHVLNAACEGIAKLRARTGMADLEVTINMSAPEVLLPGTAEIVRAALERNNLSPQTVTIEITESAFMVDLARAAAAIAEIRALGVLISLDDFGTAYSSLSWLRRLSIDKLKIDRSYVSGIEREPSDLAIVKSIVNLAKAFKRDVVAEGVETAGQLRTLRELGVDFAQGLLFAQARPLEEFDAHQLRAMCAIPARVSEVR